MVRYTQWYIHCWTTWDPFHYKDANMLLHESSCGYYPIPNIKFPVRLRQHNCIETVPISLNSINGVKTRCLGTCNIWTNCSQTPPDLLTTHVPSWPIIFCYKIHVCFFWRDFVLCIIVFVVCGILNIHLTHKVIMFIALKTWGIYASVKWVIIGWRGSGLAPNMHWVSCVNGDLSSLWTAYRKICKENAIENIVCNMAVILSVSLC